ncbi:MAG: superoxide dismutase [Kiritimatiellae bacterium]|nr:superoxide dismutase [Kiritimatiellia bacterium]
MLKVTRRGFSVSAGLAACTVAARIGSAQQGKDKAMNEITVKPLPFADEALAPVISARTLSYHYGKHHAGYVKTLNGLIAGTEYEGEPLEKIVRLSFARKDTAIFNNAAQAWNHAFYWESLAPKGKGGAPSAEFAKAIDAAFGSLDACKAALADVCVKRFGSGWGWLVFDGGKIAVESSANAETPIVRLGVTPLLVVDVWEHAYYLDWQNSRADYVKAVVNDLLDWNAASRRFAGC